MAHGSNFIDKIKLPNGVTYELHDASAIHEITADMLQDLGIEGVLVFKGTVTAESQLPTASATTIGHVYLNTTDNTEFVGVKSGSTYKWEKLGNIHNAATTTHTHDVSALQGSNEASAVTGQVTVPTVTPASTKLSASATVGDIGSSNDSVLGADTTFSTTITGNGLGTVGTTKISAQVGNVAVAGDGTAAAITGFGAHTTAAAITELNTTKVNSASATEVSIPNVTGNTAVKATKISNYGTQASWEASVDNGTLSFAWVANTIPTGSDVDATKVTLGTALKASNVTTSEVTVATGSKNTANAITALGTPTTADALTGVKVSTQPTVTIKNGTSGDITLVNSVGTAALTATTSAGKNDAVTALTSVSKPSVSVKLAEGTTGDVEVVDTVTVGSTTANLANGVAAAQKWTFANGSTGAPKN